MAVFLEYVRKKLGWCPNAKRGCHPFAPVHEHL